MLEKFLNTMENSGNKDLAAHHQGFFKTAKGEYGEGDLFLGITAPQAKLIAKQFYKELTLEDLEKTIKNPFHEIRSLTLSMCILKYKKADKEEKERIYNFYINNLKYINNWDLVDISAPHIVGDFLYNYGSVEALWVLAKTGHLWSERVSVVASHYFIRNNDFDYIIKVSEHFLNHKHDLMHKAVGWMLREVGKRDINILYEFLDKNAQFMPRTALRYSIERLPEDKRKSYLAIKKI